jgi:hypothetical protein
MSPLAVGAHGHTGSSPHFYPTSAAAESDELLFAERASRAQVSRRPQLDRSVLTSDADSSNEDGTDDDANNSSSSNNNDNNNSTTVGDDYLEMAETALAESNIRFDASGQLVERKASRPNGTRFRPWLSSLSENGDDDSDDDSDDDYLVMRARASLSGAGGSDYGGGATFERGLGASGPSSSSVAVVSPEELQEEISKLQHELDSLNRRFEQRAAVGAAVGVEAGATPERPESDGYGATLAALYAGSADGKAGRPPSYVQSPSFDAVSLVPSEGGAAAAAGDSTKKSISFRAAAATQVALSQLREDASLTAFGSNLIASIGGSAVTNRALADKEEESG